jgi:site-specific recombinase XerD
MSAKSVFLGSSEMGLLRQRLSDTLTHSEAALAAGCFVAWPTWRDLALLALLFSTAAKVSEIRLLREDHLFRHIPGDAPPGGPVRYIKLESRRQGGNRERKLELDGMARRASTAWIACRVSIGLPRTVPLFVRSTSRSEPGEDALSSVSVFKVVSQFVSDTLPHHRSLHVGPETIRNSVILEWMRSGLPEGRLVDDAGVKDTKILRRLERASAPI